ncbi:hypothetical protein ACA910_002105 [Epithemia clementina (nom. ined.)]
MVDLEKSHYGPTGRRKNGSVRRKGLCRMKNVLGGAETEFTTASDDASIAISESEALPADRNFLPRRLQGNRKFSRSHASNSRAQAHQSSNAILASSELSSSSSSLNFEEDLSTSESSYSSIRRSLLIQQQQPCLSQPCMSSPTDTDRKHLLQRMNGTRKLPAPRRPLSQGGSSSSTNSTTPMSSSSFFYLVNRSNSLLQEVRDALMKHTDEEEMLQQSMKVHQDRAKARFLTGNTKGALMSMKNTKKLQAQLKPLVKAISYLQSIEGDVKTIAERAKNLSNTAFIGIGGQPDSVFLSKQHMSLSVDLAQYKNINDDVQNMMSNENEDCEAFCNSDEALLLELQRLAV